MNQNEIHLILVYQISSKFINSADARYRWTDTP